MTVLIAVYAAGGCVGRCDARCYDAASGDCDCICGGANHGAGIERAASNTRDQAEQWVKRYCKDQISDAYGVINHQVVDQFSLFDLSCFSECVR